MKGIRYILHLVSLYFQGIFSLTYILLKIASLSEKIIGGYRKIKGKEKGQLEGNFFQQRILIDGTGFAWKEDGDTGLSNLMLLSITLTLSLPFMPIMLPSHTWSSMVENAVISKLECLILSMVIVITLLIKGHSGFSKTK